MRKELFFVLLVVLFSFNLVHAAIDSSLDTAGQKLDSTLKSPDEIEKTSSDYLKKEWTDILGNSVLGKILLWISNLFKNLNPLFLAILGVEYSLSWAFIFAILFWFWIYYFVLWTTLVIFDNKLMAFISGAIIASIVGVSGVIKKAVDVTSGIVNNPGLLVFSFFVAIIIFFAIKIFGLRLRKIVETERLKSDRQKTKQDQEIIHTSAEIEEEKLKSYKKKK